MKITSKGQVTIPIEIREQLGLLPDTDVEFEVLKEGVLIVKSKKRYGRGKTIVSRMKGRSTSSLSTDEIMALTRGNQ